MCPALWNETNATLPAPLPAFLVQPETLPLDAVNSLTEAAWYVERYFDSRLSTTREQPM